MGGARPLGPRNKWSWFPSEHRLLRLVALAVWMDDEQWLDRLSVEQEERRQGCWRIIILDRYVILILLLQYSKTRP